MLSVPSTKNKKISFNFTIILVVILSLISWTAAMAAEVKLACDPSPDQNINGYRIYYRTSTAGPPYGGDGLDQGASPVDIPLADVGDPGSPEFPLTGLAEGTYYFVCTVYDGDGNESGYSNEVSYTVETAVGVMPPASPADISTIALDANRIKLAWADAGDQLNIGLAGYRIYRDGQLVGSTDETIFIDSGLLAASSYTYTIEAFDVAGNTSPRSGPVSAQTLSESDFSLRINCGGGNYLDNAGHMWSADAGYDGGFISGTLDAINRIEDDTLLRTVRYEDAPEKKLGYTFRVPNGMYQVNLYFADIYDGTAGIGERIFNVSLEDQLHLDNLDVFARAGHDTALIYSLETTVSDGELSIDFLSQHRRAVIGAIEILGKGFMALPPVQHEVTAVAGDNGMISPSGSSIVTSGESLVYTIAPALNHHVAAVYVDDIPVGPVNTYRFDDITSDHTIRAVFTVDRYTVTANGGSDGTITPNGTTTIDHGSDLTFQIIPNAHHEIADVFVNGVSVGAVNHYDLVDIASNTIINAIFVADTHTVTATAGKQGRISPAGTTHVTCGQAVSYTFTPDAHYHLEEVRVDGKSIEAVQAYTFDNVQGDHTISASFAIDEYTITTSAGDHGTIVPAGSVTAPYGSDLRFSILPETGYVVEDVRVDGISVAATEMPSITNIQSDHTLEVVFAPETFETPIFESGEVEVNHEWVRVEFSHNYSEPIVVARSLSNNDEDPSVVRVRNVDPSGFDIRLQEWDYSDGVHAKERVGYLVMERGSYALADGTRIEASTFDSGITNDFEAVLFEKSFNITPVVITAVASENEFDAVTGRLHSVNTQGFQFGLREQEANSQNHAIESIAYIAWEPSLGEIDGLKFQVNHTGNVVTHDLHTIGFYAEFPKAPVFLADIQTVDGGDCANIRWQDKIPASVAVQVDEEQSGDQEVDHTSEIVGFIALSSPDENGPGAPDAGDAMVIDNTDGSFTTTGGWGASDYTDGYLGRDYRYSEAGSGNRQAFWSFQVETGQYALAARWTEHSNRASDARYSVFNNGVEIGSHSFDQRSQGGVFNPFDHSFAVDRGTLEVMLSDDADGYVIADAVKIECLGDGTDLPNTSVDTRVVDNRDDLFSLEGRWGASAYIPGYYMDDYFQTAAGGGELKAVWTFPVEEGVYALSARWAAYENRAANAEYKVFHNGVYIASQVLDQRFNGGVFNAIGTFMVTSGSLSIVLDNDANGYVIADAVKLDRIPE